MEAWHCKSIWVGGEEVGVVGEASVMFSWG